MIPVKILSILVLTTSILNATIAVPTLNLETGESNPPTPIFTTPNTSIIIEFSATPNSNQHIEWTRYGKTIPNQNGASLFIAKATYESQGLYQPWLVDNNTRIPGEKAIVFVNPKDSLTNMSTRLTLSSEATHPIIGFVIQEGWAPGQTFIRCIGPGLRQFDVSNPGEPDEVILRNQEGVEIVRYSPATESQLNALHIPDATCGSFPIQKGDVGGYRNLKAGIYTAEIIPKPNTNGEVLLEIYHY